MQCRAGTGDDILDAGIYFRTYRKPDNAIRKVRITIGVCRKEVFCAVPQAADMDSGAIGYDEETTWN